MNEFKQIQVVMTPTYEITKLFLSDSNKVLNLASKSSNYHTGIHIHFLSDERVNLGDWALNIENSFVFKVDTSFFDNGLDLKAKKIIASTDKNIIKLPKPKDSFIVEFIEKYNKGEFIEFVYVKYFNVTPQANGLRSDSKVADEISLNIKYNTLSVVEIDYKDNTIVILTVLKKMICISNRDIEHDPRTNRNI